MLKERSLFFSFAIQEFATRAKKKSYKYFDITLFVGKIIGCK
jgi:hypothetical protein